jgi:hypothetical protein
MNSSHSNLRVAPGWMHWAKPAMTAAVGLLCILLTGCFKISGDLQALRDGVIQATSADDWEQDIEVGVGALTFTAARAGLSFVDLPEEARSALSAARSAEVGIYRLHGDHKRIDRAAMLAGSDKAMLRAGWDRLVGVVERDQLVAVYVPQKMRSLRNIQACVLVFNKHQMVLASARSNLEPLLDLALKRIDWSHKKEELALRF